MKKYLFLLTFLLLFNCSEKTKPLSDKTGMKIQICPEINEISHGIFEGKLNREEKK